MAKKKDKDIADIVTGSGATLAVVPVQPAGTLAKPTCEIKLNTRISKTDLIEAAVYDLEEKLRGKRDKLTLDIEQFRLDYQKVDVQISTLKQSINTNYKNDGLIKLLQDFSNEKIKIKSKIQSLELSSCKMHILIEIVKVDVYGREYSINLARTMEEKLPEELVVKLTSQKELSDKISDSQKELERTLLRIKEVPQTKKKINAALIRTLMNNDIKGTEEIIGKLQEVINAEFSTI